MPKHEPTILCCYRVADGSPVVQAIVDNCTRCGAAVWRSLSSPPTDFTWCMQCAAREATPDTPVQPPTAAQLADLKQNDPEGYERLCRHLTKN